jgi:hypothetical protein
MWARKRACLEKVTCRHVRPLHGVALEGARGLQLEHVPLLAQNDIRVLLQRLVGLGVQRAQCGELAGVFAVQHHLHHALLHQRVAQRRRAPLVESEVANHAAHDAVQRGVHLVQRRGQASHFLPVARVELVGGPHAVLNAVSRLEARQLALVDHIGVQTHHSLLIARPAVEIILRDDEVLEHGADLRDKSLEEPFVALLVRRHLGRQLPDASLQPLDSHLVHRRRHRELGLAGLLALGLQNGRGLGHGRVLGLLQLGLQCDDGLAVVVDVSQHTHQALHRQLTYRHVVPLALLLPDGLRDEGRDVLLRERLHLNGRVVRAGGPADAQS